MPTGTLGRLMLVRQCGTLFPYCIRFDNDVELSLAEGDVFRVPEQPS